MNPFKFLDGQGDCRDGVPARSFDKDYLRGYALQYEVEELLTGRQIQSDNWRKQNECNL